MLAKMVKSCIAYGCTNRWTLGNGIQFHRFPLTRPELLKKWVRAVRREYWKPSKYSVICSDHFTKESYVFRPGADRQLLKDDAVPSVFGFAKHMKAKTGREKKLVRDALTVAEEVDEIKSEIILCQPDITMAKCQPDITMAKCQPDITMAKCQPDITIAKCQPDITIAKCQPEITMAKCNASVQTGVSHKIVDLRKKVRKLQMRLNRREKKLETMKQLIETLKKRNRSNDNLEKVLQQHFSGFALDLITTQLQNSGAEKHSRRYSDMTKQFALTLHFYSPKAYSFIRSVFQLPHPSIVRSWIASLSGIPANLEEGFSDLKHNVSEKPYLKECALDSMPIRKQLVLNNKENVYSDNVCDIEKVSCLNGTGFVCDEGQSDDYSIDIENIKDIEALNSITLCENEENITYYMSDYIVRRILLQLRCTECKELITAPYICSGDHTYSKMPVTNPAAITTKVDGGSLQRPSESVCKIVQHTEKCFRSTPVTTFNSKNCFDSLINSVCCFFGEQANVFVKAHSKDSAVDCEDMHETQLIRRIASMYLEIRLKVHTRKATAAGATILV